jgi:hypothetical protein
MGTSGIFVVGASAAADYAPLRRPIHQCLTSSITLILDMSPRRDRVPCSTSGLNLVPFGTVSGFALHPGFYHRPATLDMQLGELL